MTTPRTRAIRSLTVTALCTLSTLGLGACVRSPSRPVWHTPAPVGGAPRSFRFDNEGAEYVHVYLVGEAGREWLLGRVEPGARATLRLPAAAIDGSTAFVRLAVLTGERATLSAALDPRARVTIAAPTSTIASQRWAFTGGQLTSWQR
jgi:hypothetical protein